MKTLKTQTILTKGFDLLEAPRWHNGGLWMSDMVGRRVYRLALDGRIETIAEVAHRPSGLGFLPNGVLLIASMRDRRVLRLKNGHMVCHADLAHLAVGEINDMVVDRQGRAYVGSFDWQACAPGCFTSAHLILITPQGEARVVASDLAFPNGCIVTPDQKQLVLAETFGCRLITFDIGEDGSLSGRQLFADLGKVRPDGICLDAEGAVWVAATRRPMFVRVLKGGRITHVVKLPGRQAVACALGGADGHTFFGLTVGAEFEDVEECSATARVETTYVDTCSAGSP
jgi:sugar lactone lactonase YvrE